MNTETPETETPGPRSFADETLLCCECQKSFVYTVAQQQIHEAKGYEHKPKRCEECRRQKGLRARNPVGRRRMSSSGMSDRDLILEVGKAVSELRVFVSNEFRNLGRVLDEVLPPEDGEG